LNTLTYGITSLPSDEASPSTLINIVRTHWAIEGGSHQRRDVTFLEDPCDLRRDNAAHIMAILNNLSIALIVRHRFKNAPAARRFFNAHSDQAFHALVSSIP
jgi:predicted transposase YbfD/YdcC